MKPVLILQHQHADGPAYLASWLAARGQPFELRNTEAGDAFPDNARDYRAMAVLGGSISVNDPLPSLRQAEALIRDCVSSGLPVLGHCLGGQLMARALGAKVGPSPAPEIGWQPLQVHDDPEACRWFGDAGEPHVMHWHYESFGLPPGARWLARSAACPHQAFSIGPHLAMQFHIEVDRDKVLSWSEEVSPTWDAAVGAHGSVQTRQQMRDGLQAWLEAHQRLADRVFETWWAAAPA
jgi:GMP synthase (glutamine-hydrolysing)